MIPPIAYAPPALRGEIQLQLSRNEGRAARTGALDERGVPPALLARYPDLLELRAELARRFGLPAGRVLVTAGGDDALLRTCLATLGEGREALVAAPTFEMIPRYAALAGGGLREVAWPEGAFPTDAFLAAASERTAVAFVVSPNNPTGAVATPADVRRIARALPDALVVLDAAYGEFAEEDPTADALEFDNVVVVRTLSKAWGLAGLRVGCALASEPWIERLAASGNPYPVSVSSAALALRRLASGAEDVRDYVARARSERAALSALLLRLGGRPAEPASANFVLARGLDPAWTTAAAAALGVALRAFPDRPELADAVRITVPGEGEAFERLTAVLEAALRPEALLFDLDGVTVQRDGPPGSAVACLDRARLASWRARLRTAVVSARPRDEALRSLRSLGLEREFDALVCREDASPAPVRAALERLGVRSAWMLSDSADALQAARAAGVVPIGVVSAGPEAARARAELERAGAARVLDRVQDFEELLP